MQRSLVLALTAGLCALPSVALGQYTETEANDSKATANLISAMATGQTLTGSTTGTSTTTAGATSIDYWRIQTATAPAGIYRHELTLNNTAFTASIRSLGVTAAVADTSAGASWDGVVGTANTTEGTAQTSALTPERNAWYGFGKGETTMWRIGGTSTTTSPYVATLTSTPVTPTSIGTFTQGRIIIDARGQGHTNDTDFWVYDSNFNAIRGAGNDDTSTSSGDGISATATQGYLARDLTPGTYYIAMTNYNFISNQPSPSDDNFRTGGVLEFADSALCSSTSTALNLAFRVSDSLGTAQTVANTKANGFDINWFTFTVQAPTLPTNPSVSATTFTPGNAIPGGSVAMAVTVTPGLNPTSSGIAVSVDTTGVGGGAVSLLDDGVAPDATAGDNIFSGTVAVSASTLPGSFTLPISITDAQSRTGTGSASLSVRPAPSPNDFCSSATVVTGLPFDAPASYIAGNVAALDSGAVCTTATYDVWYAYTATVNGIHRLRTDIGVATGNNVNDTVLSVYDACGGTRLACDDDSGAGLQSLLDFNMTAGTTYYIQVARYGTATPALTDRLGFFIEQLTTPPTATVSLSPSSGYEGTSFNVFMTVVGGTQPASTGLAARVDLTNVGGSTIGLADDGVAPDVAAGDNIFSGSGSVAVGTALGARSLAWSIEDDQGRSSTGAATYTVLAIPTGACCMSTGFCMTVTEAACVTAGGTYQGNNTPCFAAGTYAESPSSGGAFEDISATGTVVTQGDDTSVNMPIGFNFTFYGTVYTTVNACSNGFLQFGGTDTTFTNTTLPNAATPNNAFFALWDDFDFTAGGSFHYETRGTAGSDLRFIAQWTGAPQWNATGSSNTFQTVLFENGNVTVRFSTVDTFLAGDVTVGVENADGTSAVSIAETAVVSGGNARIDYTPGSPTCAPGCAWYADDCAADYDNNGGIDGDDVIAFFADWDAAGNCADVDRSGGVDGDDVIAFFAAWDAGGVGFPGCE